jgi:cephalosporin hydroxylase
MKEAIINQFEKEIKDRIAQNANDLRLRGAAHDFMVASTRPKYSYNFSWLGRPIIQYPQDMVAMQELIWSVQPDLIIETGIAHGGSLILSASMLALIEMSEAYRDGTTMNVKNPKRRVLGVDIDIRPGNREAITTHCLAPWIQMIEGSSTSAKAIAEVTAVAAQHERVLVCLDSNHTHEHVLAELIAYAPLTTVGSYCVVFDTVIEDFEEGMYPDRPWGPGNSPKTAVLAYLQCNPQFEIDTKIQDKLLITVAPSGYLRRVS